MNLAEKLSEERRARLAAERLLEQKQAELHAANRKLSRHAQKLSQQIDETRAEVRFVRDENKRFRSQITVANEKVAAAERQLWLSIQTIQDGFAYFDTDGQLLLANHSWLRIFDGLDEVAPGISYVRMLQLATEEGIVDTAGESASGWRKRMIERWQDADPLPEVIRLWNGQYVRLLTRRGHGGDVVNLATNITDSVRYEEKLHEARARAEAASRAKSAFLANMSHEIRTPMNGVVGMAELLADTELSEEQRLYADTIRTSGEALLVIINDVLDYSKMEAEKLSLTPEPFDLEQCIHEVVTLLRPAAREKGLDVLVDYDVFLPTTFVGDRGRLRQILTNLVGNAIKFTAEGHVLIRVVGLPVPETGTVRLHVTVEDTGIGIAEDKVGRVFEEFSQVEGDSNRSYEGTGLGLAISRRLIGLMGGEIWVDSEVNRGSVFGFRITLPVADGEMTGAANSPVMLPDMLRRVLIVDGKEANRSVLARQMEALGAEVRLASDGSEALAMLEEGTDLILTDHHMPGMDGLELAQALRDSGYDIPVILLSTDPRAAEMDPARRHIAALVQRPAPRRALLDTLATLGKTRAEDPWPEDLPPLPAFASCRSPRRKERSGPENGRKLRVLAAEDNPINRTVFTKMLRDLEIELHFAQNGEEAVALWRELSPDMIFMDISMPILDGREATQQIRAAEADHRVPIIAMTAHALDGDETEILSAGLDAYLAKPLSRDSIRNCLERFSPEGLLPPFGTPAAARSA